MTVKHDCNEAYRRVSHSRESCEGRDELNLAEFPFATLNPKDSRDMIEYVEAYPTVLVENCDIGNNRARGLLISTPHKTVIRNNVFHTEQ